MNEYASREDKYTATYTFTRDVTKPSWLTSASAKSI